MTQTKSLNDSEYTYKEVAISEVQQLLANGYEVEVESPEGYVKVLRYVNKGKKPIFEITCNGHTVRASYDHLFETNDGWESTYKLNSTQQTILCDDGKFHEFDVKDLCKEEEVVDIEVDSKKHRYYTNCISSHNTNVGKTLIMCALATNMIRSGFNVLYITFEDSENKIGQRITQNLFDLSRDELKAMSLQDYQKCWNKYKNVIKANLYIKEFPEMATNALNLHAFIKELKERKDFIPDIVFVDYIGCMIPNGRDNPTMNSNTRLLTIASQVRSISMVESFPIVSGAQVNRGGYDSANIGLNDAADSFGQTMKADAILAITQSKELLDNGYYDVEIAKTRFGNNKGEHKTIRVSIDKQRIMDVDGYTSSANTSTMSDIILTDTEHSMQNAANIII